jgi:pilus assembly protein Flp/PilA
MSESWASPRAGCSARRGLVLMVQHTPGRRKTVRKIQQLFANFMREESGQDLVEYALIAILLALVAIGTIQTFGSSIGNQFNSIGSSL